MLIKQSDYHRIYRVINSLLVNENADPATAFGAANFGYIQSTSVAPRIIQLAAKIQF